MSAINDSPEEMRGSRQEEGINDEDPKTKTKRTTTETIIPEGPTVVRGRVKQSKKIPYWLWYSIAKSLGIKLVPNEKPILASVLHIFTIVSAALMFFTNLWFCGYDIASFETETDILDGIGRVLMVLQFCGIGIYSHRLSFRLFSHSKFLEMMRLHSKTVLKLNSALVVFFIYFIFVLVQNISASEFLIPDSEIDLNGTFVNPCQKISIPVVICQTYFVSQAVFSLFFLLWNVMVSVVLVSVARTHTIALRRFISELVIDAHLHDQQFRKNFYSKDSKDSRDNLKRYVWIDSDEIAKVMRDVDDGIETGGIIRRRIPGTPTSASPPRTEGIEALRDDDVETFSCDVQLRLNDEIERSRQVGRFQRLDESTDQEIMEDQSIEPHIMPEQEIMHKYWKLATQVRLTSFAFQRWMCCLVIMVGFWSTIRIVYWLSHSPDIYEVLLFILPLLSLPLLSSSYAEVNYEGVKVMQSVMPTNDRITMFQYLKFYPIEMTVYGHKVSYGTMGTVLAGIFAAFASKVILKEMNRIIN